MNYELGGGVVAIHWAEHIEPTIRGLVLDELQPASSTRSETLTVYVVDELDPLGPDVRSLGPVDVTADEVRFHLPVNGLTLVLRSDSPTKCWVHFGSFETKFGLPKPIYRIANPTVMATTEVQAYAFVVSILEPMLLMGCGNTALIHAAGLERDGSALLLTSAGGVGKTTTSMTLLQNKEWSFLSDDIGLLDAEHGIARLHPRRSMVYEYNVKGDPSLQTAVANQSVLSRVHWAAMSKLPLPQPRRRVSAADLFGAESVASAAPIGTVAFLVRGPEGSEPSAQAMDRNELVRRSTAILETEFDRHMTLMRLWDATGASWIAPSAVMERQRELLHAALANAQMWEVVVPTAGSPRATAELVSSLAAGH